MEAMPKMAKIVLDLTDEESDFFVAHLVRDVKALYETVIEQGEELAKKGGRK